MTDPRDTRPPAAVALRPGSFDAPLGRQIIALHVWAVEQGLRGAPAEIVVEGLCQRLVAAGVPLWRVFAGLQTLHPQWAGYSYTWRRDRPTVELVSRERGAEYDRDVDESPFSFLLGEARAAPQRALAPSLRRHLTGPDARLDFSVLERLAAAGATDYLAHIVGFGAAGDPSRGTGVGFSFATDRPEGFGDDDLLLIQAVLPAAALAIMSETGHTIAAGLLAAYLGGDAGARVHAGAVLRGSVESIRAVLCFADIRGFTAIAEDEPAPVVVELLDEVFESLVAPIRSCGGQVLKFLGDGILASFPIGAGAATDTCRDALAATEAAIAALGRLNQARRGAGKPSAMVDFALHLGEVLYGNVGAVDRLDFTVIGPAVNEVARIELLCEALGRNLLVSAEFAAALGDGARLTPLGRHALRGVREPREIFGLDRA
jgi:adenylate cyclase